MRRLALILACLVGLTPDARAEDVRIPLPAAAPASVLGYLSRPAGPGPFPAVALLHTCLGLPANRQALADALTGAGFIALWVDDFSARDLRETCAVDFPQALDDARAAAAYLAKLPYVDPRRLAAVGFSQGGDTALRLSVEASDFRAVAAFYPPCANLTAERLQLPTLIVIGAADSVTPAADCRAFAAGQRETKLLVLPGAGHLFDDPAMVGGVETLGMRFVYSAPAAKAAQAALLAFLRRELR